MVTRRQKEAARENIKKAQETWQEMSPRERARSQSEGRSREKPGKGGAGEYFHVEVRKSEHFATFRTHDVGDPGGIQRVAGKHGSGSWDTQKWLISKDHAHVENGRLVADSEDAQDLLDNLGSVPEHVEGDVFRAKPRPDVPEKDKPTVAQQRARQENIKKAQKARH